MKRLPFLSLPSLPPLRARLCNALALRALPCDVSINAGTDGLVVCRLEFDGSEAARQNPAPFAPAAMLYVQTGEAFWKITCSSLEVLAFQPDLAAWRRSTQQDFSTLPQGLHLAVLERLFTPALKVLAQRLGCEARFCSPPGDDPPWADPLPLILTLPEDGAVRLRLSWSDEMAARFVLDRLEALPLRVPAVLPEAAARAFAACPVEIGGMHLLLSEASGLRAGDVLLPEFWTPESPRLRLPGGAAILCRLQEGVLSLVGMDAVQVPIGTQPQTNEIVMTEPVENDAVPVASTEAPAQDRPPLPDGNALNAVELPVSFELASLRLRVEEVAALAPGLTFVLEGDTTNVPVLVRIGDRPAARGRLVDVGGMPGVQITGLVVDREQPAAEGQ